MIRIGFYTPGVMLSSELTDISVFTDHDYVDFKLRCGENYLLDGRYYTINGSVFISDIASLIEEYMAGNADEPLNDFHAEASFDGEIAEHDFTVLYCNRNLDMLSPSEWLTENFLTLTRYRRIAPCSQINLSWYTTEKEGIAVRVYTTFLDDNGLRRTYQYVNSGNGQIAHFNGIWTEIITSRSIIDKIKSVCKVDSPTLQSVTIRCGERMATFYIDPALDNFMPFWYTNCFNVPEQLFLPRVTKKKVKADRSIASVGRYSMFYDVTTSKEYEVETGPLTADECVQIEQMLTSPNVRLAWGNNATPDETDFYALIPIMITDFTSELSDTDEKPNSVKFTWRFTDNRPKAIAPISPGIFNDKFNPTFS